MGVGRGESCREAASWTSIPGTKISELFTIVCFGLLVVVLLGGEVRAIRVTFMA